MTDPPTRACERPLYPVDRAFVLEIQRDATVAAGSCLGRVEHVSSGQVLRFEDVDMLLRFLADVIRGGSDNGAPAGGGTPAVGREAGPPLAGGKSRTWEGAP